MLKMDLHLKLDFYKNAQLFAELERGHLESNSAAFGQYSDEKLLERVQPHGIIAAEGTLEVSSPSSCSKQS